MDFEKEQIELLKTIEESSKPADRGAWNKYNGDVCCRVIQEYIQRHVAKNYQVVGPNVYIEDIPSEFDLLVVDSTAKPKKFTVAYPPNLVRSIIEVKKQGIFSINRPKYYRDLFDSAVKQHPHIKCLYLTIREVGKTKKPNSINYVELMKKALEPQFIACTLKQNRRDEIITGEWRRFISCLQEGLPTDKSIS